MQTLCHAGQAPLVWTDVNPPGLTEGFQIWRFYQTTNSNIRVLVGTSKTPEFLVTNLVPSESHVFGVLATNKIGESPMSQSLVIPPILAPAGLSNKALTRTWQIQPGGILQRSFDLTSWFEHLRNQGSNVITVRVTDDAFGRQQFFRLYTNPPALPPPPMSGARALPGGAR